MPVISLVRSFVEPFVVPLNSVISAAAAAATDPNFASVGLLMQSKGVSPGSQVFTDYSSNGHTLTAVNQVNHSDTQVKFNSTSAYFDGVDDAITLGGTSTLDFGSGDFTIECWFYADSVQDGYIFSTNNYTGSVGVSFGIQSNNKFRFTIGGSGTAYTLDSTTVYTALVWHHCAAVRSGSTMYIYYNGNRLDSRACAGTITASATGFIAGELVAFSANDIAGYLDEIRITKGVARYTGATYDIPTATFPNA